MYPTSIDGSIFSCTTCIVYQYFKELGCFRFKSGCKGKGFYFNCQTFSEVFFFNFSFYIVSQALLRKGKKVKKKNKPRFFANRTAKIRTLFNNIQNFPEVFCSYFKLPYAFTLSQLIKAFFSWKAGAKVVAFSLCSKIIGLFF